MMYKLVGEKLTNSLLNEDIAILYTAVVTAAFGILTFFCTFLLWLAKKKSWPIGTVKTLHWFTRIFYNLVLTGISIFPLLGMLGTVKGLLGLDLAAEDMDNIKTNFFLALTSTAWGIIFSILYKVVLGFASEWIEEQIEWSKKVLDANEEER